MWSIKRTFFLTDCYLRMISLKLILDTMNTIRKKLFIIATIIAIALIVSSCATKKKFLISPIVPAAEGTVKVKKDKNKNYQVRVSVDNLADPGRLQPPKRVYIVWMETDQENARRLGRMETSSGMFSSGLKASFETVTTLKPRKIFISAEDNADVHYPGSLVVLISKYLN